MVDGLIPSRSVAAIAGAAPLRDFRVSIATLDRVTFKSSIDPARGELIRRRAIVHSQGGPSMRNVLVSRCLGVVVGAAVLATATLASAIVVNGGGSAKGRCFA